MFKKAYSIIINIILVILVIVGLFIASTLFKLPGNFSVLTVLTGSMEPAIKTGSLIIVRPQPSYRAGDIITFSNSSNPLDIPITHRINDLRAQDGRMVFITKGDANQSKDMTEVSIENIRGKTFLIIPYLGTLIENLKKPLGFILLIILPAILVILGEFWKIWQEVSKKNTKKEDSDNSL